MLAEKLSIQVSSTSYMAPSAGVHQPVINISACVGVGTGRACKVCGPTLRYTLNFISGDRNETRLPTELRLSDNYEHKY